MNIGYCSIAAAPAIRFIAHQNTVYVSRMGAAWWDAVSNAPHRTIKQNTFEMAAVVPARSTGRVVNAEPA
ncbi:MAG: hypothetical protein P8173_09860 [Gammaproteobacteria bacterium]